MIKDLTYTELRTIIGRHKDDKGMCRVCCQPWPCDLRIISTWALVYGGKS